MATDHTDGEPPSRGSTILANSGCTANKSAADKKIAAAYVASTKPGDRANVVPVDPFSPAAMQASSGCGNEIHGRLLAHVPAQRIRPSAMYLHMC